MRDCDTRTEYADILIVSLYVCAYVNVCSWTSAITHRSNANKDLQSQLQTTQSACIVDTHHWLLERLLGTVYMYTPTLQPLLEPIYTWQDNGRFFYGRKFDSIYIQVVGQ